MEPSAAIILSVVAVFAVLAIAIIFLRKRSVDRLRLRFGPEYERAVVEAGGRGKAQAELHQREKRVQGFAIRPLTSAERERYIPAWIGIQTQFVDDPKAAVVGADQLLGEVMGHRGYPVGDFDQRSADLSVDHPVVVQNYRTAHDISVRDAKGEASTEELRQAMLCYRALFRKLVGEAAEGEPARDDPVVDKPVLADESVDEFTVDEPTQIDGPGAAPSTDPAIDESAPAAESTIGNKSASAPVTVSS